MELDDLLKQFKKLQPDASRAASSRISLMELVEARGARLLVMPRRTLRDIFRETIQSGSALALASIALIVILGGISFDLGQPVVGTVLDPASITAEAQAIDIQVQLSGLEYAYDSAPKIVPGETTISGRPMVTFKEANPVLGEEANPVISTSTPDEQKPIGIEEALKFLGE